MRLVFTNKEGITVTTPHFDNPDAAYECLYEFLGVTRGDPLSADYFAEEFIDKADMIRAVNLTDEKWRKEKQSLTPDS